MGALSKFFSYTDKIVAIFFLKVLPEVLRFLILVICIMWRYYKLVATNYKYTSMINKKSSKFTYKRTRTKPEPNAECSICLSEFAEGDEGRELVDCKHKFHRRCLEKWLQGYTATCPLCRSLVVPEVIVAEYHQVQIEQENEGVEKELALLLLNAFSSSLAY